MTDLEILMKARALIADPKHWIRGCYYARSWFGRNRYCALGALSTAVGDPANVKDGRGWEIAIAIARRQRLYRGLMGTNDTPSPDAHRKVLAIFDRAIEEELEAWIGSPSEQSQALAMA